jgi:hypothetical protein
MTLPIANGRPGSAGTTLPSGRGDKRKASANDLRPRAPPAIRRTRPTGGNGGYAEATRPRTSSSAPKSTGFTKCRSIPASLEAAWSLWLP